MTWQVVNFIAYYIILSGELDHRVEPWEIMIGGIKKYYSIKLQNKRERSTARVGRDTV